MFEPAALLCASERFVGVALIKQPAWRRLPSDIHEVIAKTNTSESTSVYKCHVCLDMHVNLPK